MFNIWMDLLYRQSDFFIFFFLAGVITAVSIISIFISKRYIFYRLKYRDNVTLASISSLIGIIYGVLVGFIALYLIDNNDRVTEAVLREASAVANVYRDSQWLKDPTQSQIKGQLEAYIDRVVHVEWPLMTQGKDVDINGDVIIQRISNILKVYPSLNAADLGMVQDVMAELKTLYNARHQRIAMSSAQLSPELWQVILIGTILIIGINYAFRVNFYLHLFAISAFAIMAASMLFLLITLDRPFQGEFIIQPAPFQEVLNFMKMGSEA